MEFWGVEVKPGQTLKIKPDLFRIIHISQAALGEVKNTKQASYVPLRLNIGGNKYVIGSLSAEDRPQMIVDLVCEKEFELSHDWKNGSVYFAGYTADDPADEYDSDEECSDEDCGQAHGVPKKGKPELSVEEDDDVSSDEAGDSDSEPISMDGEDDFSSDDDSPVKDEMTKKRPLETVAKVSVSAKKAKSSAPEKTGNKGGQAGKAPLPKNKSNAKPTKAPPSQAKAKRGGK